MGAPHNAPDHMDLRALFSVVFRRLRKSPAFSLTAVLTLGICLAGNLTLVAIVQATLLRPLPFPSPDRLVVIINSYPNAGYPRGGASVINYFERRNRMAAFSSVSLYRTQHGVISEDDNPERVPILETTPEFFATLGVGLARGRTFTDAETKPGSDQVAVITDEFWHSFFRGSPDVVGRTFSNDGVLTTVIGVLPAGFRVPGSDVRFIRPLSHSAADLELRNRHNSAGQMIARLAPGATIEQAGQQLAAVEARAAATDPSASLLATWGYHAFVRPFAADLVREIKPSLVLLQFGAVFLLVIGVANLMNLALIRANVRAGELAVRHTLGANARHVIADAIAESVVVTLAGAAIGVALTCWGLRLVSVYGVNLLPLGTDLRFEHATVLVAAAVVAIVALLLALPVIWVSARQQAAPAAHASRVVTTSRTAQRIRHGFVVIQVALSFVLLSGTAVLGLTLKRLLAQPLGFRPEHVLTGQLTLPRSRYPNDVTREAFVARLMSYVTALPGVGSAAISNGLPFTGAVGGGPVSIDGAQSHGGGRAHHRVGVTSDFAAVMRLPVLAGRFLEPADDRADRSVCVIDRAMAEMYWPNQSPLGHQLVFDTAFHAENAAPIVGVVEVVKQNDLAEPGDFGTVYFPFGKFQTNFFYLAVRSEVEPAALANAVRRAVRQIDPELPLNDIRNLDQRVSATLAARRTPAGLAAGFSAVALLVATIGLYGVLAYTVSLREKEFGIRMAIGARRGNIVQMVWSTGARLVVIGIIMGVVGSFFTGRFVQALLFETTSNDPLLLAAIAGVLLGIGSGASLIPAARASRIDPASALRSE